MRIELTPEQLKEKESFADFATKEIAPYADVYDREEQTPPELIEKLSSAGYLGLTIPKEYRGRGHDMITLGLLCEETGCASASVLSLLTVHGMVSHALLKWGTSEQKSLWLPELSTGQITGGFGLTEPQIGSDAKNIRTKAVLSDDSYILTGKKKWISYGQIADLFLIMALCDEKASSFLVPKNSPGLSVKPINGMLGFRAAMLAEISMENCVIPKENLLGRVGFGFSHVAGTALDMGRYTIAWGSVGIARACASACISYTNERKQFEVYLKEHQLIRRMIADMITNVKAARLLCFNAGYMKDIGDPSSIMETSVAKYFASEKAAKAAIDAVQIHGANGCGPEYPVQRYMRDSKIMEIIEGSSQIQQLLISGYGYQTETI
jgi:glutaryl-CoA dehydrogenase (non-decarboxylating)